MPNDIVKVHRPIFKYHPNLYQNKGCVVFRTNRCQCCGDKVDAYVDTMYCEDDPFCICLACVASGAAADMYDGGFIDRAEPGPDNEKSMELFYRTPGYPTFQGEYWLACCNDYCAFIGEVSTEDLDEMGITDEVFADCCKRKGIEDDPATRPHLTKGGPPCGYLFRCLHCGKYHLWWDCA